MTAVDQPVTLEDLQAFVDDELSPARHKAIESHLEANEEDRERVTAYRRQNKALREALTGITDERVPAEMLAIIHSRRPSLNPMMYPWFGRVAAAFLLLAVGGIMGWGVSSTPTTEIAQNRFLEQALSAHKLYAYEKRHVVEVAADEKEHLQNWLSRRLGTMVMAPDLSRAGLTLLGGRLIPSDSGPAALLVYETWAGERVTCYITAEPEHLEEKVYTEAGATGALAWPTQRTAYAVSAGPGEARLVEIAGLVNTELKKAGAW